MENLLIKFKDFISGKKAEFPSQIENRNNTINSFLKDVVVQNNMPILPNIFNGMSLQEIRNEYNKIYPQSELPEINIIRTENGELPVTGSDIINALKECRDVDNVIEEEWTNDEIIKALQICQQNETPELEVTNDEILLAATCIQPTPTEEYGEINTEQEEFRYNDEQNIEDPEVDDPIKLLDELKNTLTTTNKYKVFANTSGVINSINKDTELLKGENVLKINNINIPTFFSNSTILEILVNDGDNVNIGTPLYTAKNNENELEKDFQSIKDKIEDANKLSKWKEQLDYENRKVGIFEIMLKIQEKRTDLLIDYIEENAVFPTDTILNLKSTGEYIKEIYELIELWTSEIIIEDIAVKDFLPEDDFDWTIDFGKIVNGKIITSKGSYDISGKYWSINKEFSDHILSLPQNEEITEQINIQREKTDTKLKKELSKISDRILKVVEDLAKKEYINNIEIESVFSTLYKWQEILSNQKKIIKDLEHKINKAEDQIKAPDNEIPNPPYSIKSNKGEEIKLIFYPTIINNEEGDGEDQQDQQNLEVEEDLDFRNNPRSNEESPQITDIRWWRKFCTNATIMNLIPLFWPVGLLIPNPSGIIKVPLPIIWTPVKVITLPAGVIAIGFAVCGVAVAPWVAFINTTPTNLGNINANSSWFIAGMRPMKKIKEDQGSKIAPLNAIININEFIINITPLISQSIPFIQDDFPPWERLSLKNIPHLLFLSQWCAAGKKSQGFFENAF